MNSLVTVPQLQKVSKDHENSSVPTFPSQEPWVGGSASLCASLPGCPHSDPGPLCCRLSASPFQCCSENHQRELLVNLLTLLTDASRFSNASLVCPKAPQRASEDIHHNSWRFQLTPHFSFCVVFTYTCIHPQEALLPGCPKILGFFCILTFPYLILSERKVCPPNLTSWSSNFLKDHVSFPQVPAQVKYPTD